jgi:hypothetical protein
VYTPPTPPCPINTSASGMVDILSGVHSTVY